MTNASILYVEDDPNDVFLLRHAFQQAGVINALQVATDGQQAVDYLAGAGPFADRQKYPLPCLVVLDLKLPRKPGFEVLEWIRQQPSLTGLVVIMFTSSHQPEDVERAYQMGANSFIIKPADIQERLDLVRHLKGWWLDYDRFASLAQERPA